MSDAGAAVSSCWVCAGERIELQRAASYGEELSSDDFAISDARYGLTHAIYRCADCGFLFCPQLPDVTPFYRELVDCGYTESRAPRLEQARRLLDLLRRHLPGLAAPRLLDVGAGSGILVEAAAAQGLVASGVEPSRWLVEQARDAGVELIEGLLPEALERGSAFDAVTLIDVIEHVNDPAGLLRAAGEQLSETGCLFVVTPDVSSLAARLMGGRWWHYRLAHIAYFNRQTLIRLLERSGFEPIATYRPGWRFSLAYLLERLGTYLPGDLNLPTPGWTHRVTIPLNFFDSILVVARHRGAER